MITLHLKDNRHHRIRNGHFWAFADEIKENLKIVTPGQLITLCDAKGYFLGRGYVNPHSLIAVRLLTHTNAIIDQEYFINRVKVALDYRRKIFPTLNSFRLIHSEADGIPGIIADYYDGYIVIQVNTVGAENLLPLILSAIETVVKPKSIMLKRSSSYRLLEQLKTIQPEFIGSAFEEVHFNESNLIFTSYPLRGQKTGFFLDQRHNRWFLSFHSKDADVLDLFCYTGAWSTTALGFGAKSAHLIDSSDVALKWAENCIAQNGFTDKVLLTKADAFDFIQSAIEEKKQYDIVILDPPALIPSKASLKSGESAYLKLNTSALSLVKSGGMLISCSCSFNLSRAKHLEILGTAAAKANRNIKIIHYGSQAPDHPIIPGHPESEYLKCVFLYCE